MKHDPQKLKLANKRLVELLAIEERKDLNDEEKSELISAKIRDYEQHPYALEEPAKKDDGHSTEEEEKEDFRKTFRQALREGKAHLTSFPEE